MSEFTSFDQAAAALAEAVGGGDAQSGTPESTLGNTATPYTPPETQPSQPEQSGTTQGDQGINQEQSFLDSKNIDLSQLDDNSRSFLEAREREMQAAFTRKTQELATQRAEAEQAMQFLSELNSNPEFALEVSQRLSGELERLGYNDQGANLDPYTQVEEDDPYLAKINELEQWKNQQEQRIREGEAASRIDRETAVIQSENPNFGEEDFNAIYGLALAHGGDIRAAATSYKSMTERSIQRYLDQKASVPASFQNQPAQTSHAEAPPEGFTSVNDKRLHTAALERLRAEGYS